METFASYIEARRARIHTAAYRTKTLLQGAAQQTTQLQRKLRFTPLRILRIAHALMHVRASRLHAKHIHS